MLRWQTQVENIADRGVSPARKSSSSAAAHVNYSLARVCTFCKSGRPIWSTEPKSAALWPDSAHWLKRHVFLRFAAAAAGPIVISITSGVNGDRRGSITASRSSRYRSSVLQTGLSDAAAAAALCKGFAMQPAGTMWQNKGVLHYAQGMTSARRASTHILFADTPSRALEFDATIKSLKYGRQLLDSMSPRTLSRRRGCWLRRKTLVFAAVWGQLRTLGDIWKCDSPQKV